MFAQNTKLGLKINIINVINLQTAQSLHGGSGRLAAGVLKQVSDSFIASGKIGNTMINLENPTLDLALIGLRY